MRLSSESWISLILFILISLIIDNGFICRAQDSREKIRLLTGEKELLYSEIVVTEVVTANTLKLEDGSLLKMIGVNTPENQNNSKLQGEAMLTGIQPDILLMMGKEAAQFTKNLVEGKKIRIEFDTQKADPSGVFLFGYVYLLGEEYLFVNAELIKKNYARVVLLPPNLKYKELFKKLERESKDNATELWKKWIVK